MPCTIISSLLRNRTKWPTPTWQITPGAFCLVCGNFGAHPWHEDVPSLSDLQAIGKYLTALGFRMVRIPTTGDDNGD